MLSQEPLWCYLYANDQRPVLVFANAASATAFLQAFERKGGKADRYYNPSDVFLHKPYGLELIHSGPDGELAFKFHLEEQAQHWIEQLGDYARLSQAPEDAEGTKRVVLLGRSKSA
jgi:hypothetical protein